MDDQKYPTFSYFLIVYIFYVFLDLEFNLFVAGELEIISSRNIDKVEKNGRIKLLKKIAYYFELYQCKILSLPF
jgi:hypothetical protein